MVEGTARGVFEDDGVLGMGLHSSTFQLNVSTFVGYVGCMIIPQSVRLGDMGGVTKTT